MKVVVTGSHGLIGGALVKALKADGHDVTRLVRAEPTGPGEVRWDPAAGTIDIAALEGHDAAVHLAGVGIGDHRWTDEHKAAVLDSRLQGTSLLASTLAGLSSPPRVLASGSAVGFYGDRGDEQLTEQSGPGRGFLADVVKRWESAAAGAGDAGIRVVLLRSGVVLSEKGGALEKQLGPFKLGLGGRLGPGRQYLSWITLEDEIAAIRHLLAADGVEGPVNVTAPNPVTNADFTKALGKALHRPTVFPTPKVALHALFGEEMVAEMLLAGQRVLPAKLTASGFTFAQPEIEGALRSVLGR
jgi:uncharacterized protein